MDLAWLAAGQVTASVRRLMGAHRNDHRGNELSARCRRSFSSGCSCPPPTTRQKHLERDRLHGRSVPNCFQACGGGGGRDVCLAHGRTSLPLTLVDANRASDWPLSTREKKTGVGIDSRCQAIDPRNRFLRSCASVSWDSRSLSSEAVLRWRRTIVSERSCLLSGPLPAAG